MWALPPSPWKRLQICPDLGGLEISNEEHISRKREAGNTTRFANCSFGRPTHCVIMVGCNPDQPGLGEEINVLYLLQILALERHKGKWLQCLFITQPQMSDLQKEKGRHQAHSEASFLQMVGTSESLWSYTESIYIYFPNLFLNGKQLTGPRR